MTRMDNGHQDARLENAVECYGNLVNIGLAIYESGGEWASGLDDTDITKLLSAFETRFPRKRQFPTTFSAWKSHEAEDVETGDRAQFPHLNNLAKSIEVLGLGGYDDCYEVGSHSESHRKKYLDVLVNISLFHGSEKGDPDKRKRFLKQVRIAAKHLLNVYYKDESRHDFEGLTLSQHPSHGAKFLADKVYDTLERHWKCECPQGAARPPGSREARPSLTKHRQFIPKALGGMTHTPARFEVLLPVCKDSIEWKITHVEVKSVESSVATTPSRQAIHLDLCQYLRKSGRMAQEHFLIENDKFWHLKAELLGNTDGYTSMEPLCQLLGDGIQISYISKCNPREQLLLCYVLANSMLYLYPSSWFTFEWTSSTVYFVRRSRASTSPALAYPYVSVQLQDPGTSKSPPDRHRPHSHPAVLAFGIMFLEIVTGVRFMRTQEGTRTEQYNEDNAKAWQIFKALEQKERRSRATQTPSGLREAIRACLKLELPARQAKISRVKAALRWFEWHNDALARITGLRNSKISDTQRVKIAILDSGIELSQDNKDLYDTEPKIAYRSWVDQDTEWKDDAGHGRHLAVLLRKLAPNAAIHVVRVFKKKPTKNSASNIAKAIRYVVDEGKVDMIVMSFGFGEEHEQLDNAIKHAAAKRVLMFAAASNDGKIRPDRVAWPAQDNNVIYPQDSMRIMVLGECVNSAWSSQLKSDNDHNPMSGTFCATPIAAGIAALILDYARGFLTHEEWERLRRVSSMRRIFERMKDSRSRSEYWWIKYWAWFDPNRDEGWIQGEIRGAL
ncbi:subtilisin-like protein [Clathrospora elynae]|uniref:Subtilisin-like protein n=1 Tax=Clathrospora elynae TaxID=706981 RepID=A0A6A5SSW3_9PLEO|nr:subtilisin-like protein [Clathrospora elynae]